MFRVGGGGGPMECGEVGCNQHREPDGPEIEPSKTLHKKWPEKEQNNNFTQHFNFHP